MRPTMETTMQYMLLIHGDETAMPNVPADRIYEMNSAYATYTDALKKAGALVSGDRLKPSTTGRVVRIRDDGAQVADGPFAEIKEQLAGYYVINADTLEAAVDWARKCPGARLGSVEVRPVWEAAIRP